MYPVSEEYIEAIQQLSVTTNWRGILRATDGVTYNIDPSIIVEGSGRITRQICTGNDIQIGTTCSSELDLSIHLENVNRYQLHNGTVTLFYELLVGDQYESVPLGIFTITEPPERSLDVLTIHAYDNMFKFNGTFGLLLVGTPYYMLNYVCNVCKVELGTTQEELANYPNGTVETYNFEEVKVYTYRDFIGYIAAFVCCYAYIGVDGKLYLKPYGTEADRTIDENWRYEYKPKDYEAYYTSISSYFAVTQEYEQVVLYNGGLDLDIGTNPLIQFNADEVRKAVLTNIITRLSVVSYTPFSAKVPCDPSLMPGDVINFTGNHAVDGKLSAITKQVIRINGAMEIECVGSDPNLNVLTKIEKQIQNAARNSNKDAIYYYDYANTKEITIGDGKSAQIILFEYTTTKETHVDFHAEIKCLVDTTETYDEASDTYTEHDGLLSFTYRQGGDLVTEHFPVDTQFDGVKLLHLMYAWWASGNILSTFEVLVKCSGCSLTIDIGASRGYIAGVGLVGDTSWDGAVHIYDDFKPINFGIIRKDFTDEAHGDTITPDESGITQTFTRKSFFETIFKPFRESLMEHGLHRFSVPYNDRQVAKVNIISSGSIWQNEDATVDGSVTTYDCEVERVLRVTSNRTPNSGDVTYLASFDSGETWYTYADGFVQYVSGYGMVEGILSDITESEWAEMIAEHGTIMIRAILRADATLTDISIYTYDSTQWKSIGPESAEEYDRRYVNADGEQVQFITSGYGYTGENVAIDAGHAQVLSIDTSIFSNVEVIVPADGVDGLLTEAQSDLNNWVSSASGWTKTIRFLAGVNAVEMLASSGTYEDLTTAVQVEPDTDYRLTFRFNTPTGYSRGNYEHRRAYIWDSTWTYTNAEVNLKDSRLLGYSEPWIATASEMPSDYEIVFNSGSNSRIRIQFGLGDVRDNTRTTMVWRDIKLRKVEA